MIQFKEISFKEAMDMIVEGDIKNLYAERMDGVIACVKGYSANYDKLNEPRYFKREGVVKWNKTK